MYEKFVKLGLFLGCHQRPERSFKIYNYQFPICSRCLGIYIGNLLGIISLFFVTFDINLMLLLLSTTIIDGVIQLVTKYESNNYKRVITGFLSGFALVQIIKIVLTFS